MLRTTIMIHCFFLAALFGCFALSTAAAEAIATPRTRTAPFVPPMFEISDLQTGRKFKELRSALTTTGLLTVRVDGADNINNNINNNGGHSPSSFSWVRNEAMKGLCRCKKDLQQQKGNIAVQNTVLDDGISSRSTVATATIGSFSPLALPEIVAEQCGADVAKAMDLLRDEVAMVSNYFIQALDRIINYHQQGDDGGALLAKKHAGTFGSVHQIVQEATHLEHFHVYSTEKKQRAIDGVQEEEGMTLELHTDAGLFLAFVPAMVCEDDGGDTESSQDDDSSFMIRNGSTGELSSVSFPQGSIAIMMGTGAEYWLQTNVPLRATRHAVQMRAGDVRAWYGMMHLVPESAVIQSFPEQRTFGEMKRNLGTVLQGDEAPKVGEFSVGCAKSRFSEEARREFIDTRNAARLQVVNSAADCNNATNFFCWMRCMDIPNYQEAKEYIDSGHSLYCLDPQILAATGNNVAKAVEPCLPSAGHNHACMGDWTVTAPNVPGYPVVVNETNPEKFCYGSTSMYMDGFHWLDSTCIVYLVPNWILDGPGLMWLACLGTIVFGAVLEGVILGRRLFVGRMSAGGNRLASSTLFYGGQLTIGYLLMLIIMTYSGPLFLSVVVGLMLGHALFNAQDAIFSLDNYRRRKNEPRGGDISNPQLNNGGHDEVEAENGRNQETAPSSQIEIKPFVPEGVTPCCQNYI